MDELLYVVTMVIRKPQRPLLAIVQEGRLGTEPLNCCLYGASSSHDIRVTPDWWVEAYMRREF